MLTNNPTVEMIKEWKSLYEEHCKYLKPNHKSGMEVDDYFCKKYAPAILDSDEFRKIVEANIFPITMNRKSCLRAKCHRLSAIK